MRNEPLENTGAEANRGIGFPRLYDLLLLLLIRGHDQAYREDLLDLADVAAGHSVLDVGCGAGTQAIVAWPRSQPGGSVVGVDISEKMLAPAHRKARLRAPLSEVGFEKIEGGPLDWLSFHFLRAAKR
jgi:ubiquinone/menaquinone biosynthesis C-methylase UbiE